MSEITINYTYSKQFKPNTANIIVYFNLTDKSKEYLYDKFNSISKELSDLFSKNIKLSSYSINQNFNVKNNVKTNETYILNSSFILRIKLKDNTLDSTLEKLNKLENISYSIDFKLNNFEKYKNEVLKETIELANKKCEFIAKQTDKKIEEIKSISYSSFDNNTLMVSRLLNSYDKIENINIEESVSITYIIN